MKRKFFKRLMAASLATVMVAGMAGCGGDTSASGDGSSAAPADGSSAAAPSSAATPSSEEPSGDVSPYTVMKDANGNVYDLGGKTFKIFAWWENGEVSSEFEDARADYRAWAQETYNFKMEWSGEGDWGGNFNKLGELAVGGLESVNNEYRAYLVPAGQGAVMSAIKEGLVWDIKSLGVIDFSESRFALNGVADAYTINGGIYGMSAESPEPRDGVWFNKDLLEKTTGLKADDLYDLQKNNEWTWAKFEEICQKIYENGDTDNDGTQDIYALAANTGSLQTCFCISNGIQMFDCKGGEFVYQAEDPAVIEAFDEFLKVLRADYYYPQPQGADWDYFYPAFDDEGKIVFLPEQAYHTNNRLSANDETNAGEYGFLMFPIGPKANGQFKNKYEDNVVIIPKCYNEQEAREIALAYSIWYAEIPGFEGYNPRLEGYEANCSDERMLNETLARMMSEGAIIKAPGVPGIDVGKNIAVANFDGDPDSAPWWPEGMTASQMVESCAAQWKQAVEDANK